MVAAAGTPRHLSEQTREVRVIVDDENLSYLAAQVVQDGE
jgi:hypothetical protein